MSSPYACRWSRCAHTFPTLPELRHHFVHDHIPTEGATYVPAHKRRRRDDGGWELVEELSMASQSEPSQPSQPSHPLDLALAGNLNIDLGLNITEDVSMTTLSSLEPSFAVPSLPPPFAYSQEDVFGFLRSPSPERMQSTPVSQVPPPSQPSQSTGANTNTASQNTTANTSASSAALVSPARGRPMTQAIPPPSVPTTTPSNSQCSSSPVLPIGFGSAKGAVGTPGRKVSASGFTWGMGK